MTKQQYKIFTAVRKYKKLGKVLEVTKVGDYIKLQETVGADMLDFSDVKYDDDTDVTLSTKATEAYEKSTRNFFFNLAMAIATISTAIITIIEVITERANSIDDRTVKINPESGNLASGAAVYPRSNFLYILYYFVGSRDRHFDLRNEQLQRTGSRICYRTACCGRFVYRSDGRIFRNL